MRNIYSLLAAIAMTTAAYAQQQWTYYNTGLTTDIYSVFFIDSTTGWVAGAGGFVKKTTAGGVTGSWVSQNSTVTLPIRSIYMVNSSTGWMVGDDGTIVKTTNGGSTWTPQTQSTTQDFYGVYFVDANTGWAVGTGPMILKTTNGGTTWSPQTVPGNNDLFSIWMINSSTGYACGENGTFLSTTDGGTTWNTETTSTTDSLKSLCFASATEGFVVGKNSKVLNTDGSVFTNVQPVSDETFNSVYFVNDTTGWVVGDSGKIYMTKNAGQTWTLQNSQTAQRLFSVHFPHDSVGYCGGKNGLFRKYRVPSGVGMNEADKAALGMSVYPNPASGLFSVSFFHSSSGNVKIELFDLTGKPVKVMQHNLPSGEQTVKINIRELMLPEGIYFVRLNDGSSQSVSKLIIN